MDFKKSVLIIIAIVVLIGIAFWVLPVKRPPEPKKVSATFVATGASGMLAYTIEKLELDKKHGLELTMQKVEPGEVERRLFAREVDIADVSPFHLIEAKEQGMEIRVFAPYLTSLHSLLVRADSDFYTVDDLKGKKLATLPKATAAYKIAALELGILGIDLDKDFVLTFGSVPETLGFLEKREVDAAFILTPLSSKLLGSGQYREILNLAKEWENRYGVPYFFNARAAHADWIEANPDTAKRFAAMSIEAAQYVQNHPEIVAEYARQVVGAQTEAEISMIVERLPKVLPARWDEKFIANAIFVMQKAAEFGFVKELPENPRQFFIQF